MDVYVVTEYIGGEYSDRVVGVFSTKERAEECILKSEELYKGHKEDFSIEVKSLDE